MRWRRKEMIGLSSLASPRLNPLFFATRSVRSSSVPPLGVGITEKPALVSCQTYWLAESHGTEFPATAALSLQPLGFGPAVLLPFTTYMMEPVRFKLTEFGYQPVGISPTTRLRSSRSPSPSCSFARRMTATALMPPSVTYSV